MRFVIPLIVLFAIGAQAQEHNRHPVRDLALHEKFYSTWHNAGQSHEILLQ